MIAQYRVSAFLPSQHFLNIYKSKCYMESHLHQPIDIAELAAVACMSPYHYIRTFKRVYGLTPGQFLKDMRIAKAKKLLIMGVSVTACTYAVGYQSVSSFSLSFKRAIGISPRRYQQHNFRNFE